MSEIEVGEYIKTNEGVIGKIKKIEFDKIDKILKWYVFDKKRPNMNIIDEVYINKPYILKHSKNIIDLIEAGDYVNDKKVIALTVLNNEEISICVFKDREYMHCEILKEKDITSIVTKEQFDQIKYTVKEN